MEGDPSGVVGLAALGAGGVVAAVLDSELVGAVGGVLVSDLSAEGVPASSDVDPDGVLVSDVDPDGLLVSEEDPEGVLVSEEDPEGVLEPDVDPDGVLDPVAAVEGVLESVAAGGALDSDVTADGEPDSVFVAGALVSDFVAGGVVADFVAGALVSDFVAGGVDADFVAGVLAVLGAAGALGDCEVVALLLAEGVAELDGVGVGSAATCGRATVPTRRANAVTPAAHLVDTRPLSDPCKRPREANIRSS